jgi:transglutaminase-like putative cysteine protease
MEKRRPQLSLDELQEVRWLLGGGLVLIAIGGVWALDVHAGTLATLTAAAVLAALVRPELPARVPPWAHALAFPLIVVWFGCDLYLTAEPLPAMVRLNLLLLLYRGASYRQKRDDLQIIVLGLILVMTTGVLTVSLMFAGQILLFTAAALALLFVMTLAEAAGGETPAAPGRAGAAGIRAPAWTRGDWRRLAGRWRSAADGRLLALGAVLFLGVVAVSALLFVAVPRFQIDSGLFWGRLHTVKSRTGFSDTIHLDDVVDIQQDATVALRVDVSDPTRVPAVPYWRMVVLDEYRDGEFRTSRRLRTVMTISAQMKGVVLGSLPPPREPPATWTFYLEPGISRHLPLTGEFSRLRFQEPQWVQRQPRLYTLALRNEPAAMIAYRVEGMRADGFVPDREFAALLNRARKFSPEPGPAGAAADGGARRRDYPLTTLELPAGSNEREALRAAVAAITGGAPVSAGEFASRASRWLAQRHGTSLEVTLPPGPGDPAMRWLLSDQPGHCELFTAAFTLLARAAGFPTRAVTGFRGGDWNGFENYLMVRNTEAHAWCEVYDGTTGWFRVDPTAGAPAASASPRNLTGGNADERRSDRSWRARLDAYRVLWYRRIVSFDERAQAALLTSLREGISDIGARLRAAVAGAGARLEQWLRRPWKVTRLLGWGGAAVAVAALAVWWRRRGRPWWWRVRGRRAAGRPDPVRRWAGRWLRRIGAPPAAGEPDPGTPRAERAAVWADLQRLRYGPRATWPEPGAVFRRARRVARGRKPVANRP